MPPATTESASQLERVRDLLIHRQRISRRDRPTRVADDVGHDLPEDAIGTRDLGDRKTRHIARARHARKDTERIRVTVTRIDLYRRALAGEDIRREGDDPAVADLLLQPRRLRALAARNVNPLSGIVRVRHANR